MAYVNTSRAQGSGLRNLFNGWVEGLADRSAKYRLYRRTVGELNGLTDRELADLGLHRSNVTSVAYAAAYGK